MANIKQKKNYYHATPTENRENIMKHGIKVGVDSVVYLTDSLENALKFMALRFKTPNISVFEVSGKAIRPLYLEESLDHSEKFFQCKAWQYSKNIPPWDIVSCTDYGKAPIQ